MIVNYHHTVTVEFESLLQHLVPLEFCLPVQAACNVRIAFVVIADRLLGRCSPLSSRLTALACDSILMGD